MKAQSLALWAGLVMAFTTPVFAQAESFRIDMQEAKNFTTEERSKLDVALNVIEVVVNSPEFQERVLNHTWNDELKYANNKGLTNEQILEAVLNAQETFSDRPDSTMNFSVTIYNAGLFGGNVVGYTNKGSSTTHVNRSFFKKNTPARVAANLLHEWTHMLGFSHDYRSTAQRPYSVPYAMGSILATTAKELGVGQAQS